MALPTRARAKIAEDIAALKQEVRELRRTRGAGPPDAETLVSFMVAAVGSEHALEVYEDAVARGWGAIAEAVGALVVAPAAQGLQTAAVAAFEAAVQEELSDFVCASQPLREALLAVLLARAEKWRRRGEMEGLFPPSWQSQLDPAERVHQMVPKLNRWEVLLWAGKALGCARGDVWRWQLWQLGWREYQEDEYRRGRSSEPMWQRELADHTLPEVEAEVMNSWPVPPDDDWPEGELKRNLLRLRKWQQQRAAQAAAAETIAKQP